MHVSPRRSLSRPLGAAAVLVGLVLPALVVAGGPATAATASVGSVLKGAKAAIGGQNSVHVSFDASSKKSKVTEKILVDVSRTMGVESVAEGNGTLAIRVTPTAGYVSGNATGLTQLYGLSAAQVKKVGSNWVAFKPSTSQYATLKSDVTFSAVLALLPKTKGTKVSTKHGSGTAQYVLKWTSAGSGSTPKFSNSLTLDAGATKLPMTETETDSGGVKVTTALSNWGESVTVAAPSPTIDSSAITG
jgi:hypothetical protein